MRKIANSVEKALSYVVAALMAFLVVDVTWQVISRDIIHAPSSYTEELALFLMLWISLLGAAYAYRRGAHLGLDIVVSSLAEKQKQIAHKLTDIVCLMFASVILVYGGLELVTLNLQLEQTSAAMQVKFWKVYSVIPLSGILFAFFALERLFLGAPE